MGKGLFVSRLLGFLRSITIGVGGCLLGMVGSLCARRVVVGWLYRRMVGFLAKYALVDIMR